MRIKVISSALCLLASQFLLFSSNANATNPTFYESISGTTGANIDAVAGSSDSYGFTGNWTKINAFKNPGPMTGAAGIYKDTYNSKLRFPTNSRFALPASNTAASTTTDLWNMFYSARQMTTGVNFDSNSSFYFSFLNLSPISMSSTGSAVLGLITGLPTSTTDSAYSAIYLGRTYSGAPTVHRTTANQATWNVTPYTATGSAIGGADASGNAWFVIAKITTVASGSDSIQLKFYASTDSLPTSDSSIMWDVTYTGAITGTYNYLAVQNEYNGTIDEIRGGTNYASVSGIAQDSSATITVAAGDLSYRKAKTLTAVASVAGKLTFKANNIVIPGCKNLTVNSGNSLTVNCVYKPAIRGVVTITTVLVPSDAIYNSSISASSKLFVNQRSGAR